MIDERKFHKSRSADSSFGSNSDLSPSLRHDRFTLGSGHDGVVSRCRRSARRSGESYRSSLSYLRREFHTAYNGSDTL